MPLFAPSLHWYILIFSNDTTTLQTHHKEICLAVDTAKLILASYPKKTRLVISGIGREFQPSMGEMLDAVSSAMKSSPMNSNEGSGSKCLILFPTEDARTFTDISSEIENVIEVGETETQSAVDVPKGWDVIVIDGTWSQARKMHAKYFPQKSEGCLYRVELSRDAVQKLDSSQSGDNTGEVIEPVKGHQLRRHPIKWREIATFEATRLLLNDMHGNAFDEQSDVMSKYQEIGNDAAKRQLGPPRQR